MKTSESLREQARLARQFGKRFRKLLDKSGESMTAFSRRTGVSESSVSHWYNGETYPTEPYLLKIANAFGVDAEYLRYGSTKESPKKMLKNNEELGFDKQDEVPPFSDPNNKQDVAAACFRFTLGAVAHDLLRDHCKKEGISISAFVRRVVEAALVREKDDRLRVDLDEKQRLLLDKMASIRNATPAQEAKRILQYEIDREWALIGDYLEEMKPKQDDCDVSGDEPVAAERVF